MINIETQIEINASAAKVWDCLIDFARYPEWNPLLPFITGEAKVGAKLHARFAPPNSKVSNHVLDVLSVVPQKEFRWLGHFILPGFMDGNHVFIIHPLSENKVLFIHTESFNGFLVPFLAWFIKGNIREGFEQMNLALKNYIESVQ